VSFAYPWILAGLPLALIVLAIAIAGDVARRRAAARLGEARMIDALTSFDAGSRRALKGALRILALIAAIVALARPRTRGGEKVTPAADVSAIIALDLSKSMYAEDVPPSRIARARLDATRMIEDLPQIRWGAVAFAGEAAAYPPTTDVKHVISFLHAHEPSAMPGGTAIGRALELARRNLVPERSTEEAAAKSQRRKPVIVLVTDGEDLEGDPVSVARAAAQDGIAIHVVAVGSRAPQPIPNIDPETGKPSPNERYVHDETGASVMTELTPQAEDQLRSIARETGGLYVRAEEGQTGIAAIEAKLRAMIATVGVERRETLYTDQYAFPLAAVALLLILESLIAEAPKTRAPLHPTPPPRATGRRLAREPRGGARHAA
jgi:Ca-activated chloride channel family protein